MGTGQYMFSQTRTPVSKVLTFSDCRRLDFSLSFWRIIVIELSGSVIWLNACYRTQSCGTLLIKSTDLSGPYAMSHSPTLVDGWRHRVYVEECVRHPDYTELGPNS